MTGWVPSTADTLAVFSYAFLAWFGLTILTYLGIRAYLYQRGEPVGWRFNHHGARAFPGHLSFYPRDGNERREGVVFRPVHAFPLFWTISVGRSRSDLETVRRGPVWSVIPWGFRWMANRAVLSVMDGE